MLTLDKTSVMNFENAIRGAIRASRHIAKHVPSACRRALVVMLYKIAYGPYHSALSAKTPQYLFRHFSPAGSVALEMAAKKALDALLLRRSVTR